MGDERVAGQQGPIREIGEEHAEPGEYHTVGPVPRHHHQQQIRHRPGCERRPSFGKDATKNKKRHIIHACATLFV